MPENRTPQRAFDLADALQAPRRPSQSPRMPPASLEIRVRTSLWVRRLLPTGLVVQRAARSGAQAWTRSPERRAGALAAMEAIVAGTARAHELTELAREHLIESEADRALFWQPWPTPSVDAHSIDLVRGVLHSNRGVLISSCHLGPYFRTMSVFAALGQVPFSVAGRWFFEKPSPDYWGRRVARWRRGCSTRLIRSDGSFPILLALLERGELVFIFFDMPGPRGTRFLGKPTMLADGTARLAMQTGALVLPLRARRVGHRVWVDAGAPLDPHDFADVNELHCALAALHESWILELPATMADPNSFGWGEGATPAAWIRPEPVERPSGSPGALSHAIPG